MKILSILLFQLILFPVLAQDYMDKIAEESCECLAGKDIEMDDNKMVMELGLCMLNASMPYKKQLKKDYDIDLDKIDEQGEALGQIIGMRMISFCPDALISMAGQMTDEFDDFDYSEETYSGVITLIDDERFVIFSIKNNEGKTNKFYWLNPVDTDFDLELEYKMLKDKEVYVRFMTQEIFDPRINEYRSYNVLLELNKRD